MFCSCCEIIANFFAEDHHQVTRLPTSLMVYDYGGDDDFYAATPSSYDDDEELIPISNSMNSLNHISGEEMVGIKNYSTIPKGAYYYNQHHKDYRQQYGKQLQKEQYFPFQKYLMNYTEKYLYVNVEQIRVMVVGDVAVGKSAIIQKICNNSFANQYTPTLGIDICRTCRYYNKKLDTKNSNQSRHCKDKNTINRSRNDSSSSSSSTYTSSSNVSSPPSSASSASSSSSSSATTNTISSTHSNSLSCEKHDEHNHFNQSKQNHNYKNNEDTNYHHHYHHHHADEIHTNHEVDKSLKNTVITTPTSSPMSPSADIPNDNQIMGRSISSKKKKSRMKRLKNEPPPKSPTEQRSTTKASSSLDIFSKKSKIEFVFVDVSGQERYNIYCYRGRFRNINAVCIVYDVTNPQTFDNISYWKSKYVDGFEDVPVFLVANKMDKPQVCRKVSTELGMRKAQKHGFLFCDISAKTDKGCNKLVDYIARALHPKIAPSQ